MKRFILLLLPFVLLLSLLTGCEESSAPASPLLTENLADYTIVLTLCQLSGIEGVTISVANDPMPFRYRQTMTPDDILLDSRTTLAGTMTE